MKFKSIKMHNFMRYKGENILNFSCNPEKNVTIVLGNNTFGKTTLAQAFRWGLYEDLNTTNYTKKKDMVLLNNEVIAKMSANDHESVSITITVEEGDTIWEFERRVIFKKKNNNPNDLSIVPIHEAMLTMQITSNGIQSDIINNDGTNGGKEAKKYQKGCVQDTINSMFPSSLANYFFFDGERWSDSKNKTNDIRESINTILGVTPLIKMKEHIKEGNSSCRNTVIKVLRGKIQGSSDEAEKLRKQIEELEQKVDGCKKRIDDCKENMDTASRDSEKFEHILNDNKKAEEDQRELNKLEKDISNLNIVQETYYADIVKMFSNSAKYFASALLPEVQQAFSHINLEGKDIPGVTKDTIEYLIDEGTCLCGTPLNEDSKALENLNKLKKVIPPEMIGGAAGKYEDLLADWSREGSELFIDIESKAQDYNTNQDNIDEKERDRDNLIKRIDKKTNMEALRRQYNNSRKLYTEAEQKYNQTVSSEEVFQQKIESLTAQMDEISKKNEDNAKIYRCIAYAEKLFEIADSGVKCSEEPILDELNTIIGENFDKMFNDKEKYAKLGSDYKIHVYYHQVGKLNDYEEDNLSNGEIVAINFVYIVSILELAKRRKQEAEEGDNTILNLPLVLDGPFSNLSNENTELIASKLPEFAEQVIIFMLDKDWEASGLRKLTLPDYCYRVQKELKSNSSSIELNGGDEYDA